MGKKKDIRKKPLLEIRNLEVHYSTLGKNLEAIRNLNLDIYPEETYGLVGESGCGKSTLAFAIMNYLGHNGYIAGGEVLYLGENLVGKKDKELRDLQAKNISMVYQNPSSALNPVLKIGEQLAEIKHICQGLSKKESMNQAIQILEKMKISDAKSVANRFPHQLSGGMKQRVCIGMALISNPSLLIMDEPTTNLDVTTEQVILDLILDLKVQFQVAIIYISHDLGVVKKIADKIGIMYLGELVEEGSKDQIFLDPIHPYTKGLLQCVPKIGMAKEEIRLNPIPGTVPALSNIPTGCVFSTRCQFATDICAEKKPLLNHFKEDHRVSCFRMNEGKNLHLDETLVTREKREDRSVRERSQTPLLQVEHLKKYYTNVDTIKALDDVSLHLDSASTLGIVGESGCGKTTLARSIIGLLNPTAGKIIFDGQDVTIPWNKREKETLNKMQMVFQTPETTLNPAHSIKRIIGRPIKLKKRIKGKELEKMVGDLLEQVRLDVESMEKMPFQMSGGQKQRVAIARAFAVNPKLVICDEPTSSLDVSVQASVLNLLLDLQEKYKISYLFISHDLNVVYYLSDYIAVTYLGRLVEYGRKDEIFNPPYHPYTEALIAAVPVPDPKVKQRAIRLSGSVPSAINPPPGCPFHTRCPKKIDANCETKRPPVIMVNENHKIVCHIPLEELKEVEPVVTFV